MHGEEFFRQALIYLGAAVLAVPVAQRLGLGSVLGYLLAGMAVGPFALGLIGEEGEDVMHFAEFGVVMMLFLVGLELQPSRLWRMRGPILGLGFVQVAATAAAIAGVGLAVGLAWQPSLAVGLTLALSSTAIVLQTLNEKGLMKTEAGQSSFAVLLFQDIAVIPILALLPLLAVQKIAESKHPHGGSPADQGHGGHASGPTEHAGHASGPAEHGHAGGPAWIDSLPDWAEGLVVLGAVLLVVLAGQFLVRPLLRFVASTRMRESFTAAALLLVIGIALLMTQVGLSPALGTFVAGVVLANSEYRHELESDIEPFKGLLLGVFFVAVGASIDFALIAANPALILQLVAALMLLKLVILFAIGRTAKMSLDQNFIFAFGLAQGGEFAFVLFSFAKQAAVLDTAVIAPLTAAVALSMALTPLLVLLNERLILPHFGTRPRNDQPADAIEEENAVIVAGFGEFGGTITRFLRANGIRPTVLDHDSDRVELLRRLGLKVYYGDARRPELLHSAGAHEAKLLVVAVGDREASLEVVHMAKKHFPHLEIMARASRRPQSYELLEAGVEHLYRDTLDTSLRAGVDVLRFLGVRAHQALRSARRFRHHDEEALRQLAEHRHDEKSYVSAARARISDLEAIMLDELERETRQDDGWDADTIRREVASGGLARPDLADSPPQRDEGRRDPEQD